SYAVGSFPHSVAVGDFDRDGTLDLAVTNDATYPGSVRVLLGNGDGTFQTAQGYAVGYVATSVTVGNLDGDGIPDLVVAGGAGAGQVSVLRGKGDGTFPQAAQSHAASPWPSSVAVRDFNGDGHADIVVANFFSNAVSI